MKDPQKAIIQAVYDVLQGLALPVYVTLPLGVAEYVLLSQPTLTEGRGSAACPAWDATLLVSVYTKFERGQADTEPALNVGAEIMDRLKGERLSLGNFSMSPIELQRLSLPQRYDDVSVYVQDNLRLRFTVYGTPTVVTPRGQTINDFTPAQILADYAQLAALEALVCPREKTVNDFTPTQILAGYTQLAALGPLNCPVAPTVQTMRFVFSTDSVDSLSVPLGVGNPTTLNDFSPFDGSFSLAVNGQAVTGRYVGQAGDTLLVTRLSGNPTVQVGYNSALG